VEQLTAVEAVEAYPERQLFCAWPTAGEAWAAEAVARVRPGLLVAMILDARSDMTGDAALVRTLDEACAPVGTVVIPQFPRVQDRLIIRRRL